MSAKFTKDSNFFVLEVGRGSGVLERSLEIAEVLRGEEGDDEDRKPVCTYFGKRFVNIYLFCLVMNLSWRSEKNSKNISGKLNFRKTYYAYKIGLGGPKKVSQRLSKL